MVKKDTQKALCQAMEHNVEIEKTLSGWYVAFIPGRGYLKADTFKGLEKLIRGD